MIKTCPACEKNTVTDFVSYEQDMTKYVFEAKSYRCSVCKSLWDTPESMDENLKRAKSSRKYAEIVDREV